MLRNIIIYSCLAAILALIFCFGDFFHNKEELVSNMLHFTPAIRFFVKSNNVPTSKSSDEIKKYVTDDNDLNNLYDPFKKYLSIFQVVDENNTREIIISICNKNTDEIIIMDKSWTPNIVDVNNVTKNKGL